MPACPLAAAVSALVVLFAAAPPAARGERDVVITFDSAKPGSLPAGIHPMSSTEREPGHWEITKVGPVTALTQTDLGRRGYRLAVIDNPRLRDVRVGVRLRVARGDRAAGVAWRVQDAQNYYAARLDFESGEVVLYKFIGGNRIRLSGLSGLRLDPDAWHELLVEHHDRAIHVWLNGIPVASNEDGSLRTGGRVGFWLPGDGTAHFARMWYAELERSR